MMYLWKDGGNFDETFTIFVKAYPANYFVIETWIPCMGLSVFYYYWLLLTLL